MKTRLVILGCGSSVGVPRIDGFWGSCNKNNKKNLRTRSSAIIIKGKNSILIDTSADLRCQLLSNKIKNVSNQFPLGIPTGEINGRSLSGQRAQLLYDNQPLYEFYLPIFEGYDAAGLPIYKDTNGDGVVNPNFDGSGGASDRDFVGDPNPDITIGIALNARYKNFDISYSMFNKPYHRHSYKHYGG